MEHTRIFAAGLALLFCQAVHGQDSPTTLLLKDYDPVSIYRIPASSIAKARFSAIDMHSHAYAKSDGEIQQWIRNMDQAGIEKTIILTELVGPEFDAVYRMYSKYPDRFEVWCGLLFAGYDKPGYTQAAVNELIRCHRLGARGVGELHDKGQGMALAKTFAFGMHPDDPRLAPVFAKCGELGLPVSIHVADPIWMYQKMDRHNDGLMNAWEWRLDNQSKIADLPSMIEHLEALMGQQTATTFIVCHLANLDYDLDHLSKVLARHPNLYADISARYAETAATPRAAAAFYANNANRLLYGTDMGLDLDMYRTTFRILETRDEHFYSSMFGYHWYLNAFDLPDPILQKIYKQNAAALLGERHRRDR